MATRIILVKGSVGTSETELQPDLQPPSGIRWTIVELRPRASASATVRGYFDTELYHEMRTSVTPGAYPKPHTIALDIQIPHVYTLKAFADTGTATVEVEVVVEESPAPAPGV